MEKQQQRSTKHFTFVAKVKPGRGKDIRAKAAKRAEIPWEQVDKLLRPLTLHYARWLLFDNDTRFIYYASFDTELDRYLDDAARIFASSGAEGFFPDLEGFPDDQAAMPTRRLSGSFCRKLEWKASTNSRVILVLRSRRSKRQ